MATRLLLARVGAGKTAAVQRELHALKQRDPLARVWVLLSTERQIADFRRRFMVDLPVSFNIDTFNFYTLYRRLLALAGNPQRCLDDASRYGLIRALLADLYRNDEGVFAGIAHTPGFISIMATFLLELKQNLILPEQFEAAATTSKEHELARIYAHYQTTLQDHKLVDREGEGWLAVEALEVNADLARGVDLLIVDGYDQFNFLQATLLALLGAQVSESIVTLTTVPEREATIGRRFQQALDRLTTAYTAAGVALERGDLVAYDDDRAEGLLYLSEHLLRPHAPQISADGAVTLIEAPDPAREVGAILRHVKRLLLDGCAPDDILIAVRDWGQYGGQIAAQGRRYGLPLALQYGDPLAQNPAVVALLNLIDLHAGDFRRRDLLDALRSPYFAVLRIDAEQVDLLERISLELRVLGGRSAWLDAVALAAQSVSALEDEDAQTDAWLTVADADQLGAALVDFFAVVTPPDFGATSDYVAWLEGLIGADLAEPDDEDEPAEAGYTLNLPACIRAGADAAIVARDLTALQALKGVLRGLLSAQNLATSLNYERRLDRRGFARDLATAVAGAVVERGGSREGRVLVTTVADARGLPHRYVFIPGLSEGIFPQPAPEDPLLLDSERLRLQMAGVDLPTQAERAGDDGLFYSLIGQVRESLTLSRPHSKNGESWAASHLWRAVLALFSDLTPEHLKLGAVVADPATAHEAALAAADALSRGDASAEADVAGWADPADWSRIRRGHAVEIGRMSRGDYDHYSGRLHDADLIAQIVAEHGVGKVWSASQLNDLGVCGFRYYAKRLLALEPLDDPADGMNNQQLGTLNHEILEATYAQLGGAITDDRLGEALGVFDQVAAGKMRGAPGRLRFRASAQWEQAQIVLRRKLEKLIRDDFGGSNPLTKPFPGEPRDIYRQELKFGLDDLPPLTLDLGGEALRIRGAIDRIDRQGDRAILVDYKSGSTEIPTKEIEQGRNFQMLIYLLAAQALIEADGSPDAPRTVAGGVFWHLSNGKGDVVLTDDALIETGTAHIARYLDATRKGDFAAHANKRQEDKCTRYCEFHQLCRINVGARGKV